MTVGFPPRPLLGASGAATELGQGRQVAAAMAMAVADGRKGAEGGGEKTEGLVPTAEETWVAAAWAAVVKAQEGQVMGVVVRRAEAATGPEAWARAVGAARARGAPEADSEAEGVPAALPPEGSCRCTFCARSTTRYHTGRGTDSQRSLCSPAGNHKSRWMS